MGWAGPHVCSWPVAWDSSSAKIFSFYLKSCTHTLMWTSVSNGPRVTRSGGPVQPIPFFPLCPQLRRDPWLFPPTSVTPDLSIGTLTSGERWPPFRQETRTHTPVSPPRRMKCNNLQRVTTMACLCSNGIFTEVRVHVFWPTIIGPHVLQRTSVENPTKAAPLTATLLPEEPHSSR